ncbi:MAG: LysR family transcriptional regulator [Pseudomonadota bacterium]
MVQEIRTIGLPALRSFSTVARLGAVSAAADRLGVAKSGVSRHVAQLEKHFGMPLLERGARSVSLTPFGERLHLRVASILAEIDLLDDIAREESTGVSGQVSIATMPEFGAFLASTLFPIIGARHPDLTIVMRTEYAFEDLRDTATDIAFRVGTFKDDRLVARRLGAFRALVVASPKLLSKQPIATPQALSDAPCLVFRGDRPTDTWTLHGRGQEVAVDVTGPVGVWSFTILLELAVKGLGFALLPEFMVQDALRDGRLIHCLPGYTSRALPVFLTFRPGARRIARVAATIALAEEHVPPLLSD